MISPYKNLFLRQSYLDQAELYERVLSGSEKTWDYVIITASNEAQALSYRQQIDYRLRNRRLPSAKYLVIPDPDGKRVGSGGATLNVLRQIAVERGSSDFSGLKIFILHSGGNSKRVPQYSACGKLFSPVPRTLADGRRSTLFDEFMIGFCGVPARMADGAVFCSGDVLLLFNPLQIDFYSAGAAALSIKEDVETGKEHGVYSNDENGNVGFFLHKQSVQRLKELGAVDSHNNVDIDTGSMIFDSNILNDLYSLVDTDEKFASLVNEHVRLSLYADFNYPLAASSTLESFYSETPEGDFSPELHDARTLIWQKLHRYSMKLIRFSPASFLHFGTTDELLKLMADDMDAYSFLGWSRCINSNISLPDAALSNSYISRNASIGSGSYIEDSYLHQGTVIGRHCVISGVTLKNVTVPDNTVLHGLKLTDGRFVVRMYGVRDNPKDCFWKGQKLSETLWSARLFPVCQTMEEAVAATLSGAASDTMISLEESFIQADVTQILPWQEKLNDHIKAATLLNAIDSHVPVSEAINGFNGNSISDRVIRQLTDEAEKLDENILEQFSGKIRIYYYLSKLTGSDDMADRCFGTICSCILNAALAGTGYNGSFRAAKDKVVTRLPVRVNFGGGWSDTPPYCMEHGGTVLNAAITLNGECPIEVTVKKAGVGKIILASTDIGSYREFTDIRQLQDCRNPQDAFALHKAALIACGVIPYRDDISVEKITAALGSGIYLNTRVINIPKGSGLGTSSILAGACVKSLYEFLGVDISDDDLYSRVLCMEQIMSTGGGWQDQVGGLASGIKMVTAGRGLSQKISCTPLNISAETKQELDRRFAIIYTGQRRLARNLLRDVVGRYIGNTPEAVEALYEIQQTAVLMRFELEKGNVDGFAALLSKHWELSQKLDAGCTNTCIDQIFISIDDLIDGRMICGAGGGGFLQVVMKKDVTIDDLRQRLNEVFADSGVDAWVCSFT